MDGINDAKDDDDDNDGVPDEGMINNIRINSLHLFSCISEDVDDDGDGTPDEYEDHDGDGLINSGNYHLC